MSTLTKKETTAKWIWLNSGEYPEFQEAPAAIGLAYNTADYQYCVAEFETKLKFQKEIHAVKLRVSGDAQFRLWMNGELVGIGPASSGGDFLTEEALPWHYANRYEVNASGKSLQFFAQVQLLPQVLTEFSQGHGGFYLEGEVVFLDGTSEVFGTDEGWMVRKNNRFSAPKVYDEGIAPDEWHRVAIVENRWNLIDAPIPMLTLEGIAPQMCKKQHEADAKNTTKPRMMVRTGDTFMVLFDKIYSAYIGIRTDGPCRLTVGCFELEGDKESQEQIALSEAGEFFTFRMHSVGGMRIYVENAGEKEEDSIEIEPFLLFSHYPVEQEGVLHTSDAELNKIFDVSKWTLKICRQTIHLDSPKHQELLACTGDYFIETKMTAFTFGDMRLAEEDIRRTARWLEINDGRMFHTNYSLIWVQWIWFTYLFTGDVSLLEDCKKALEILLERFHSYLGDNGVLEHAPDYMFLDWVVRDGYSIHHPPKALGQTALNAFYYKALTEAVKIAGEAQKATGKSTSSVDRDWARLQNLWEQRATELKIHFHENFYDEESGLYIDGLTTPTESSRWLPENPKTPYFSRYGNTLAALYGLCRPEDAKRLVSVVADVNTDLPQVQPYFMHFVLDAVYQEGLFEKYGMKLLGLWKEMVRTCDKGLQEGWIAPEPTYKFDHSHAWGGTPAYHLPLALLGFEMLEPGFKKIALAPNLWGLEFAEISFPTPYGEICCVMKAGEKPKVTVPEEIEVVKKAKEKFK